MSTILIIDDEQNILVTLSRALSLEGYDTEVAGSARIGLEKLSSNYVDLVLLDVKLPDMDGLSVLEKIMASKPGLPVIMMSGHATVEIAVRAVTIGAMDFLEKPLSSEKVLVSIANTLKLRKLVAENQDLRELAGLNTTMVGSSKAMEKLREEIRLVAPSQGRVLITGENGTGKELVARAIHEGSDRRQGPFVKLNCAAVPRDLIESELFGHEKGSFTGANQMRRGKFESAHGGTLLLDEIGDMPMAMQAKLLRVLQEGELERVGSSDTIKVDVRVLAATNQDLPAFIEKGLFRQDLYYRLNVIPIQVPALRQRKTDIPELAEYFLHRACKENNRHAKTLAQDAIDALTKHDFPGNVRELKNSMERLAILTQEDVIHSEDVHRILNLGQGTNASTRKGESFYEPNKPLKEMMAQAERSLILRALADCDWHMTNAAKHLGLERSHLYKKMKALGIKAG